MDLTTFRVKAPEFQQATDDFVQAYLDEAELELNSEEFGNAFDAAHRLLAAHKMAMTPFGQSARMVQTITYPSGAVTLTTCYEIEFARLIGRTILGLDVV